MSAWMITRHGRDHYLSAPESLANTPDIADIASALAQINRFTGHARRPYSVAEHSLFTARLAKEDSRSALVQLACLMHDAHEAYTGDLSSPAKNAVGLSWGLFEHRQADLVRRYYGLRTAFETHKRLIQHYDLVALATEREQLTVYDARRNLDWPILDAPGAQVPPCSWANLNSIEFVNAPWTHWRDAFLLRFHDLQRDVARQATALLAPTVISPSL